MKDHIPVPVLSLVFGAARCGSFCCCSTANVSVFSVFVLHWLSAYVHVVFKVFEVWLAWRVVPSLVWTGGSLMLQGCKQSLFLQQKNWVQMLIADAKIKRAYYSDKFCSANPKDIVHPLTNSAVPVPRQCAYYSDRFCSANSKDIVHTILTKSAVPIPWTLYILLRQILRYQSQGHTVYYSCKLSSANPNLRKFSSANPKDTVC